jgi:hypothetical protein
MNGYFPTKVPKVSQRCVSHVQSLGKLSMRIMRAPYIFAFRGMDWGERVMAKLLIYNDLHNPMSIYVVCRAKARLFSE